MTLDEFITLLADPEPPAPAGELAAFEADLGARLPDDYRQFLTRANGGTVPKPMRYRYKGVAPDGQTRYVIVSDVGGLRDDADLSLRRNRKSYVVTPSSLADSETKIPKNLLWIMGDPGGNATCLAVAGPRRGQVFRWVHDEPPSAGDWDGEIETAANIVPLAASFTDFIAGFGPNQDDDAW